MSDLPLSQDKKIISTLMKAYEHKEIEKLKDIQNSNSKILKRIRRVEDGKELSVGHHQISHRQCQDKSLSIDRKVQVAKQIDFDNFKTNFAIATVKPIVPAHNDQKEIGNQVKYLKLSSKCRNMALKNRLAARMQYLHRNCNVSPKIDSGLRPLQN